MIMCWESDGVFLFHEILVWQARQVFANGWIGRDGVYGYLF